MAKYFNICYYERVLHHNSLPTAGRHFRQPGTWIYHKEGKTAMNKKIRLLLIIATALCLFFGINRTASAADMTLALNEGWTSVDTITNDHKVQYYKVVLPSDGKLTVTLQSWINYTAYKVWDADLTKTYDASQISKGTVSEPCTKKIADRYLPKGTYYIQILQYNGYTGTSYTNIGDYRLKAEFTSGKTNEVEPNNTAPTAIALTAGKTQTSLMWEDDEYDYYKLTLNQPQTVKLTVKSWMNYITMGIRDAEFMAATDVDGVAINDFQVTKGSETEPFSKTYEYKLGKGTWYVFFKKYTGYTGYSYTNTGIYSVKWLPTTVKVSSMKVTGTTKLVRGATATWTATVKPANATNKAVTWSSANTKIAKVSSKGVVTAVKPGKTTIKATAKDGSGVSVSRTVIVIPKKMGTPKAATASKSGTTVTKKISWTKQSAVTGYQIQYGTDKTFAKSTKKLVAASKNTFNIKKNASKQYYVRVRAYIKIGSKRYYGAWSSVRAFK